MLSLHSANIKLCFKMACSLGRDQMNLTLLSLRCAIDLSPYGRRPNGCQPIYELSPYREKRGDVLVAFKKCRFHRDVYSARAKIFRPVRLEKLHSHGFLSHAEDEKSTEARRFARACRRNAECTHPGWDIQAPATYALRSLRPLRETISFSREKDPIVQVEFLYSR